MTKIDFSKVPYNHSGRWHKKFDSIFAPEEKVTWPQYISECVVFWRIKLLKDHPQVTRGKGWSKSIQREFRMLVQQASVVCNFFPHPDDEPLVIYSVKKFLRERRVCSLGGFRKYRTKVSKAGNEVLTITQAEKDVINGIQYELDKVVKARNIIKAIEKPIETPKENITFGNITTTKKKGITSLKELDI